MMRITRDNSDNPDFSNLTSQLDDELCRIYNTRKEDYEEYNRITGLNTVVLAYEHERPVGCGCFKILDNATIELKRMYVAPDFRSLGIASALVNEMEKWGIEMGYSFAFLETGKGQPQAIAMYQKLGYRHFPNAGQYEESDRSICMKKDLKPENIR